MIREVRRTDLPRVLELLETGFPEDAAFLLPRRAEVARVARRILRWDTRLLLGIVRLLGAPVYRFFVAEVDARVVATLLLTFPERAGFVSMLVVDAAYRRRGIARALLARARESTAAVSRPYLALNVLRGNSAARALYEKLGFRTLGEGILLARVPEATSEDGTAHPAVRPFRASDASGVVALAHRGRSPEVEEVLPLREGALEGSGFVRRVLASSSAAWVVDRGAGPMAYLSATVSPTTESGHCSEPIVGGDAAPEDVVALVRTAIRWCSARRAPRLVTRVAATNDRALAALRGAGFREVLQDVTLYRTVA